MIMIIMIIMIIIMIIIVIIMIIIIILCQIQDLIFTEALNFRDYTFHALGHRVEIMIVKC